MELRCRPGDLAMYVGRSSPLDVGKIVRVVMYAGKRETHTDGRLEPAWHVDPPLWNSAAPINDICADSALRPIRDPGDDAVDQFARTKETTLDATDPLLRWVVAV